MAAKIFKRYKYDIALQDGVGAHMITWITGLMVFFMTLMLVVNLGLASVAKSWVTGLSGSITVEIKPPLSSDGSGKITAAQQKTFDDSAQKILWLAKQHPAVSEARALSKDEIKALIQPWLGDKMVNDLPLPALIDLKLANNADIAKLETDITNLVPAAVIDTHDDTLDDVKTLIATARAFVMLLTAVILVMSVLGISGIVSSKFSIHKGEAEILHHLGANDEYIARQFRHHTLQGTLLGAIAGVACMLLTLAAISYATHTIDTAIMPHLKLLPANWMLLILSPVIFGALIAHLTAQVTVMRALSKIS